MFEVKLFAQKAPKYLETFRLHKKIDGCVNELIFESRNSQLSLGVTATCKSSLVYARKTVQFFLQVIKAGNYFLKF